MVSLYFLFSLTKSFKITIVSLKKAIVSAKYTKNHWRYYIKKSVLKNFGKFIEKHLCWSLFHNKFVGLKLVTLFQKRLRLRCFSVNIVKNTYEQLLPKVPRIIIFFRKDNLSKHAYFFP